MLPLWKKSYDKPRQYIIKQRHYFVNKGPSSQSYGFSSSHVWIWELDHKEGWTTKDWCFWTVVLEKTLASPLDGKGIKPVNPKGKSILNSHWKDWCWSWSSNTLATWCEELTHLKGPWCCERLKAGGDGEDRGQVGWMASPTQCTWVWASSGRQWRTGKPDMLQSMRLQRVGHNWLTKQQHHFISLNENEIISIFFYLNLSVNILYNNNNNIDNINCNLSLRNYFSNFKSLLFFCLVCVSHSVLSDSLQSQWLYPPGSSAHGILQVRILEWVASSFSRRSSWPRIKPGSPTLQADSLPSEPPGKPFVFIWS